VSDYELLQDVNVGLKPKEAKESEGAALDHASVAKAVEHGKPQALGTSGALHLQRVAGNAAMGALVQREAEESPVKEVVGKGGGSSLDSGVRKEMESKLGHDFGDVRIHTDGQAAKAATSVQAKAFTSGTDVVFNAGNYQPDTAEGKHMLAHELTHVVQQRSGPVDGTSRGDGTKVSDPSDRYEQEAEATAKSVMAGGGAGDHAGHDHGGGAAGVQRDAEDDVQTMRDTSIQRAEDEKESEPAESEGEDEKVQGMFEVQRAEDEKESEAAESEGEDEKVQGMFEVQRDESAEDEKEE
jgi:hypothetical protein